MIYLTVLNTLILVCYFGYKVYHNNPFFISVNRTFWRKKLLSYTLMYKYSKSKYSWSARGIFTIKIRNAKKWNQWDSDNFKTKPKR